MPSSAQAAALRHRFCSQCPPDITSSIAASTLQCLHQPKLLLIDNVSAFYYQDRAASAFTGAAFPTAAASPAPRGEAWARASPVTTGAAAPWQQQPQQQHSPLQQLPQHLQHQAPSPGQAGAMGPAPSPSRSPGPPAAPPLSLQRVHAAMAALVRLVCREARCGCVCAKYASVWSGQAGGGTDGSGDGGGGGGGRRFTSREVMSTPWQALVTHRCVFVVGKDMGGRGLVHWVDGERTGTEAEVQAKRTVHTLAGYSLRPLIHPSVRTRAGCCCWQAVNPRYALGWQRHTYRRSGSRCVGLSVGEDLGSAPEHRKRMQAAVRVL